MDRPATPPTNLARSAHLDQVVESLVDSYPGDDRTQHIDATFLPSRARAVQCIELVRKIVFPGFFDEERLTSDRVRYHVGALAAELDTLLYDQVRQSLRYNENKLQSGRGDDCDHCDIQARDITDTFLKGLPELRRVLALDVQAAFDGDPAAIGQLIVGQRRRFGAALAALSDEQWAHPSRCEGWSARDVALHMATANALAAVEGGARQIECTIHGLGERAGNTALEEIVMALKVRNDIMPFTSGVDSRRLMQISRRVATVSGFPVQYNKAIVGKNAFAHESGIHQDGMLKNAETFEIMRPEDVGLSGTSLPLGKHSGRAALRAKLAELGFEVADNQLKDVFVRFKALADRKKEVHDDDVLALMRDSASEAVHEHIQVKFLRVICGTEAPQSADLTLTIDGQDQQVTATGDGPVDAVFNAVKALFPHDVNLQLYQVHAVTEGTDAQATVSVRLEEDGRIATGQSADTDTVVASAKAYVNALNRLVTRRETSAPGEDVKTITMTDTA